MVSPQILRGDGAETVLDADGIRTVNRASRTEIPFAVVQEARTAGGREVEIVLTDGAVHRVDGGNATAATAFVTALTAALPEQRDPGGSARVTVTSLEQPRDGWRLTDYVLLTVLGAPALTYLGYAIWTGVTRGSDVIVVIVGAFPLFSGLLMLLFVADDVRLQLPLRKRGITVVARLDFRAKDGAAWYKYTDADGVEHHHRSTFRGPRPPITYDPQRPGWASTDLVWGRVLFKIYARGAGGLLLVLAGGALALAPLLSS
ncbi:hypothetical protein ACIGO8_17360 [Streptomyces sp. NPDC053493]|uniref:hypothetical protein n=1 Tax=Streptomyces sp. NPDC053493 TaxID=3365705 RepID=UPI0037D12AF9